MPQWENDAIQERVNVLGTWLSESDLTTVLGEELSLGEKLVKQASQLLEP